jgi:hypothetical protein
MFNLVKYYMKGKNLDEDYKKGKSKGKKDSTIMKTKAINAGRIKDKGGRVTGTLQGYIFMDFIMLRIKLFRKVNDQ